MPSTQSRRRDNNAPPTADTAPEGLLARFYGHMAMARALDDRIWNLSRQGTIPFAVTGRGQEAAQVGLAGAVRPGVDYVFPYYRDVALVLGLGMSATEVMLAAFGRRNDPSSAGRQMPNHFSYPALRVVSGSSPVGTQIPQAAGTALACRFRGEDAVTLVTFGEGASSQGDFHEGLNFAAIHRLPVVFACENNGWAISVPQRLQVAGTGVAAHGAAYGIPGVDVDGRDPVAVHRAAAVAVARAREGAGPTLLEIRVPRLDAHTSSDDDTTYRPQAERQALRDADPLPPFRARVVAALGPAVVDAMDADIAAAVDAATRAAEVAPVPSAADLLTHVYAPEQAAP